MCAARRQPSVDSLRHVVPNSESKSKTSTDQKKQVEWMNDWCKIGGNLFFRRYITSSQRGMSPVSRVELRKRDLDSRDAYIILHYFCIILLRTNK